MRILIITDIYGWAFETAARGYSKYSKYKDSINIKAMKQDLKLSDFEGIDFVLNMCHWECFPVVKEALEKYSHIPFVLWNIGHDQPPYQEKWIQQHKGHIVSWDELFRFASPTVKKYHSYVGVDTSFFEPMERENTKFRVGWVGFGKAKRKRLNLLSSLNFGVLTRDKKYGYLTKNRDQSDILDFYHNMTVYINISTLEGGPLTLLEAMSCGLPAISTRVGIAPILLEEEWLLPIYPSSLVIERLEEKLEKLKNSKELSRRVGDRNRQMILERFSWERQAKELDNILESICEER